MNFSENIGIKYGAILGLLSIIFYSALYAISTKYLFNQWIGLGTFVVIIITMVMAARHTRQELGGYGSFGQLVAPAFAVMVVAQLLGSIYNYLLYNFIDPSLTETLRNFTSELTYDWMSSFGSPDEEIERALDEIENQDFSVTLSSSLWGFASSAILAFMIASVIALILRRKPPLNYFENEQPETPHFKPADALPVVKEDPVYPETVTEEPDLADEQDLPNNNDADTTPQNPDFPR